MLRLWLSSLLYFGATFCFQIQVALPGGGAKEFAFSDDATLLDVGHQWALFAAQHGVAVELETEVMARVDAVLVSSVQQNFGFSFDSACGPCRSNGDIIESLLRCCGDELLERSLEALPHELLLQHHVMLSVDRNPLLMLDMSVREFLASLDSEAIAYVLLAHWQALPRASALLELLVLPDALTSLRRVLGLPCAANGTTCAGASCHAQKCVAGRILLSDGSTILLRSTTEVGDGIPMSWARALIRNRVAQSHYYHLSVYDALLYTLFQAVHEVGFFTPSSEATARRLWKLPAQSYHTMASEMTWRLLHRHFLLDYEWPAHPFPHYASPALLRSCRTVATRAIASVPSRLYVNHPSRSTIGTSTTTTTTTNSSSSTSSTSTSTSTSTSSSRNSISSGSAVRQTAGELAARECASLAAVAERGGKYFPRRLDSFTGGGSGGKLAYSVCVQDAIDGVVLHEALDALLPRLGPRGLRAFIGHLVTIVAILQAHGVRHNNIHSGNVLVTPSGLPVLINFLWATTDTTGHDRRHWPAETSYSLFTEQGEASDVYAMGVVIDEILSNVPSLQVDYADLIASMTEESPHPGPANASKLLSQVSDFSTFPASGQGSELHIIVGWDLYHAHTIYTTAMASFDVFAVDLHDGIPMDTWQETMTDFYHQEGEPRKLFDSQEFRGKLPFLVVFFWDHFPRYGEHPLKPGHVLNLNTYEFKRKLRDRKVTVHASDSPQEVRRNLHAFGYDYSHFVAHARPAYDTLAQVFDVLNALDVPYLVLRNFEGLPTVFDKDRTVDVDLLTTDYHLVRRTLGGIPLANPTLNVEFGGFRIQVGVNIGGQDIPFDIRCVGDGYYPTEWYRHMLDTRAALRGFYAPNDYEYFYSLVYHVVVHKGLVSAPYRIRLLGMAQTLSIENFSEQTVQSTAHLKRFLDVFLSHRGYEYVRPSDAWVGYNV